MTRMKRTLTAAVLALCLTAGLAVPALALGEIDPKTPGSVTLNVASNSADGTLDQTETDPYREDLAEATTTVSVYKLADVNANGLFTLTETFAPLVAESETWNGAWNGGILNAGTKLQDLTAAAVEVLGLNAPAEGETPPEEPAAPAAVLPKVFENVKVVGGKLTLGEELGLGLFLLIPEKVETGEWVYTFSPILLSVPSIEREEDVTDDGVWLYDVPVTMKPERTFRTTEIVIDKTLKTYNETLGPTTFVFEVTATKPGKDGGAEVVYSNMVSVTFKNGGTQSVTVTGIPVGAKVTVKEVYSGASYAPEDGRVSVTIDKLELPEGEDVTRVPFTNDYTWKPGPDQSVENRFVFNGKGWDYVKSEVPTE